MLRIYNSLTRQKEEFVPLIPGKVRMYVCGMTVYDYCHLGHARVMVVFDVVYRLLRAHGYDVDYVRNITDIDDKIIARAHEQGISCEALTERFIQAMHEDSTALNILPPTQEPKATEYIPAIQNMISRLIERGHAYAVPGGDVYYAVASFPAYGQLSGKDTAELRAGARVEVANEKRDPLDFVLWKLAKPGEPSWDSPWGRGRPGWHIECSAMSTSLLGDSFDIHGGGSDLQFPHHENEIAQSVGATGKPFVKTWMHNGFIQVDNEKMSKSLGNFFTIREILQQYRAEEIRMFMLMSQYRSPLNYQDANLQHARQALTRFYTSLRGIPVVEADATGDEFRERFFTAMNDDFNTPEALAVLFEMVREINRETDQAKIALLAACMRQLAGVLGILETDPEAYLRAEHLDDGLSAAQVEALIEARKQARVERNWAEADRIRDELAAAGIVLEDSAAVTTWRRV